jgi:hypothetical protein
MQSSRFLLCAFVVACGDPPATQELPDVAAMRDAVPISGTYRVSGTTVDEHTGSERGVSGTIVVKAEGDTYTTTFSLNTTLLGSGEPQKAELIGHGEGTVTGRDLTGTAETQLIVALVPGVDAGFGMLPRVATARILNRANASIDTGGGVRIEIESEPAPGETYAPTRTTLRGRRIAAVGLGETDAVELGGLDAFDEPDEP